MQSKTITPPAKPASAEWVRALHDALGDLHGLALEQPEPDRGKILGRYELAIEAVSNFQQGLASRRLDLRNGLSDRAPEAKAGVFERNIPVVSNARDLEPAVGAHPDVLEKTELAEQLAYDLAQHSEIDGPHDGSPPENGAPRGEHTQSPEATPSAGALARSGDPSKASDELQSRHPDLNRRPADYESAGDGPFSPRAQQLAALAWELVDRDPELAARVAYDLVELDEHDPVDCAAVCCNSPLALEVRP